MSQDIGMKKKLLRIILAIAAGNAIYFSILRFLPERLQHEPFQFDEGLLIDFFLCLLLFFILSAFFRDRSARNP